LEINSGMTLKNRKIIRGFLNNIVWIIFILLMVIFSLSIKNFFSVENYINIIYHSVFIGMLAIAQSYVLISGNMDLSVESTAAFSAIISVWLCASSPYASGLLLNTWFGFIIILIAGAAVGMLNAFFIVNLKINSFLVTLSTYILVRALAVWITGGYGMNGLDKSFRFIDVTKFLSIPLMVFLMIILYILFEFILRSTRFGKHIYIIGGNVNAAYNFGINVNRTLYKVFILSGVVAALTGWLMAARTNGATAGMGNGFLFEVLAAVVIGGVSLSGGVGSLIGVFAGTLILSSIHGALNITAASPFITGVIRGVLILVAVSLDALKRMFK
jgi:ribose transport system permease protein